MKIRLILVLMLNNVLTNYGMEIDIPKKEILEMRLRKHGLEDFMRISPAAARLAGSKKTPKAVGICVVTLIIDYSRWAKSNTDAFATRVPEEKVERILLQSFLQDNPDAMQALEMDKTLELCGPIVMREMKLPLADVLCVRVGEIGLDHFIKHSGLADDLGNSEKSSLGVRIACDRAIERYHKFLHQDNLPIGMIATYQQQIDTKKQDLLGVLLQDVPEALQELEELYGEDE